ncbi:MAG TPA: methionine synthase [Candidatus Dormibacteraeota bacterium]|nr:methionine synthase [Candidatus Dormibacteraeota bacterium]
MVLTATRAPRAEHVGSLLRPPELLRARAAHREGRITLGQLREVEDRAILEALRLQGEVGLDVLTDGEYRRESWLSPFWDSLDGLTTASRPTVWIEWHGLPEGGPSQDELQLAPVVVNARLRRRVPLLRAEAAFLLKHAPAPFKVTMPSPTMTATLYVPGITDRAYPTPADMVREVAELQVAEVEELADLGVGWVQVDSLRYLSLLDERLRQRIHGLGVDTGRLLEETIALDNHVIGAAKRRGLTVGLHLCRGNNRSAWMASGGYEPIAERLFAEILADRLLLEYDSERAGGFEPLRFVAPGKTVVLGLVSTKTPVLESQDDLCRRIEEASRYVPIENLALGPQCGFASTLLGNLITVDDQRRKLELVVDTARRVWG